MRNNPLRLLGAAGQGLWLDTISREIIRSGYLRERISKDGLRGVTSNPAILHKAIAGGADYNAPIEKLARRGQSAVAIYEALAIDDIRHGADILRRVYDETDGEDGYISFEVAPHLAFDTEATVTEARRLWEAVDRPNLFIKVPATQAGLPAIRRLIAEGINVNVTLMFSLENYAEVMEAYIAGLEERSLTVKSLERPVSVASFFLSRIDTMVDWMLANRVSGKVSCGAMNSDEFLAQPQSLLGKAAIASARVAYQDFKRMFSSERFERLRSLGAHVQRPLWASTSTKNAGYSDVRYVEPLVGEHTVNTMPISTMDAWRDHGVVRPDSIEEDVEESRRILAALKQCGVDLYAATTVIQEQGVTKFCEPFDQLMHELSTKRVSVLGWGDAQSESFGEYSTEADEVAEALGDAGLLRRLWGKDPLLWSSDPEVIGKIANRLGWLASPQAMLERVPAIVKVAEEVRKAGFKRIVLLGMGGSSLCPEVCASTFGSAKGHPELTVLDTTSPDTIGKLVAELDLSCTLFIVASKSGTTIETNTQMEFFWDALVTSGCSNPGRHFIAITDPGTELAVLADEREFRAIFQNPADIGGRFSALSCFGLVPMAMIGIDIKRILERAIDRWRDGPQLSIIEGEPATRLGVALGVLARRGRDKLTFVLSPKLGAFGYWVEQLIAESTGKIGRGILPVEGEKLAAASKYGSDRVLVEMSVKGEKTQKSRIQALEKAGIPVVRIRLNDVYDLGVEFMRWEIATAAAGTCLNLNPFDEPNVTESKQNSLAILKEAGDKGKLPVPSADLHDAGMSFTFSSVARIPRRCKSAKAALAHFLESVVPGDYVAILAFLEQTASTSNSIGALRTKLRDATRCATTVGFGPRYLHSTGQFHKGGPNSGVFMMLVADSGSDVAIPGKDYTFGTLFRAQALGDFRSLQAHGRRAVLIDLGEDVAGGLKRLRSVMGSR